MSRARLGGPSSSGRLSARAALAGKSLLVAGESFEITRSRPHGHLAAVATAARSAANAGSGNAETFARVSCRILPSARKLRRSRWLTDSRGPSLVWYLRTILATCIAPDRLATG